MLIEFSVSNFRSILDRQTLSLVASSYYKEKHRENLTSVEFKDGKSLELLRSSVIYGANASGKSNLLLSFQVMRDLVVDSAREGQVGDNLPVEPFFLSKAGREGDTEFEATIVEGNVRYQYGFSCNTERVSKEWLIAYPNGRAQKWFERALMSKRGIEPVYKYRFSKYFLNAAAAKKWALETRANALFLSILAQRNETQTKGVFGWFKDRLKIVSSRLNPSYTMKMCTDPLTRKKVVAFLNSADLSISDIEVEKRAFSEDMLSSKLPSEMRAAFFKSMKDHDIHRAVLLHKDIDSKKQVSGFELEDESDGTQGLFAFAGPWIDVTENNRVILVDELDTSLHPLVVHHLVRLFHASPCQAQLIFSTHDVSLLSERILRRDQIWLMERPNSQTKLYSLEKYSPREKEAIDKGYMAGRFGGIPFLSQLDFFENKS